MDAERMQAGVLAVMTERWWNGVTEIPPLSSKLHTTADTEK
jgi:hypothetical protein